MKTVNMKKAQKNIEDCTLEEAMAFEPQDADDVSCVVRTGAGCRTVNSWRSRKAAIAFYRAGASACGGSEGERYLLIADFLAMGCRDVCDDDDHMTKEMLDKIVEDCPDTPAQCYEEDYAYAEQNYPPVRDVVMGVDFDLATTFEVRMREIEGALEEAGRLICDAKGGGESWHAVNRAVAEVQEAIRKAYLMGVE